MSKVLMMMVTKVKVTAAPDGGRPEPVGDGAGHRHVDALPLLDGVELVITLQAWAGGLHYTALLKCNTKLQIIHYTTHVLA